MTQEDLTCDWCNKKVLSKPGYTNHVKVCKKRIAEQGEQFNIPSATEAKPEPPKRVFIAKDKIKIDYELDDTDRDLLAKRLHRQLLHDLSTRFGKDGPVVINLSPDEAKGLINLLTD